MNVLAFAEGVKQCFVLADVSQDTQFHLGVVTGKELVTGPRYKTTPYLLPYFTANGDILQIGIAAR